MGGRRLYRVLARHRDTGVVAGTPSWWSTPNAALRRPRPRSSARTAAIGWACC